MAMEDLELLVKALDFGLVNCRPTPLTGSKAMNSLAPSDDDLQVEYAKLDEETLSQHYRVCKGVIYERLSKNTLKVPMVGVAHPSREEVTRSIVGEPPKQETCVCFASRSRYCKVHEG